MKFGDKVRVLRLRAGLSQTELGNRCGLSLRTIRNYEVDGRYPKQREVYSKLAQALDCDLNYLLTEDDQPTPLAENNKHTMAVKRLNKHVQGIFDLFTDDILNEEDVDVAMQAIDYAHDLALERFQTKK